MKSARTIIICGLLAAVSWGIWVWWSFRRTSRTAALAASCFQEASRNNWRQVETLALEWSQLDSGPSAAWYWLGEARKHQHRFDEAVAAFSRLELTDPRGMDAAASRMEVLFHGLHRVDEALSLADQVLAISPALAEPRRERIYYFAMTLQRGDLIREIHKAVEHQVDIPDHYSYLLAVDDLFYRDGAEVIGRWRRACPGNSELAFAELAQIGMNARAAELTTPNERTRAEHQRAREDVLNALHDSPGVPVLLGYLLISAQDRGDVREVGELLSQVPDAAADDPLFWRLRGWYAVQSGEMEQAEKAYLEALRLHPLSWLTRNEMSILRRLRGENQEAARMQRLAAEGNRLLNEIRRSGRVRQTDRKFLQSVAKYAQDCGELSLANAIHRRIGP